MAPISVQLYSLREESAADFDAVLAGIAQIGIAGVEPFNLFGKTPQAFRAQVEDLGMQVSSTHYPWATRDTDLSEVVDTVQALGLGRAPGGFMPDDFADRAALEKTIERTQRCAAELKRHDLTLFPHNHWWEYAEIDGRPAYYTLQDALPEIEFEIDTYWAARFGQRDPAAEVARVADRAPLLHIKDGPLVKGAANVAVGSGALDIADIIGAADPDTLEWLVIEFDSCDTDTMDAIAGSYRYLIENQLGQGND